MALKRIVVAGMLGLMISGCGLHPTTNQPALPDIPQHPSPAWVEQNLPLFRQAVERVPSDENRAALARLEAYADAQGRAAAKLDQVDRNLTLAWDNYGRGGAVLRQPAYIHVLNEPFNQTTPQSPQAIGGPQSSLDPKEAEKALTALAQIKHAPSQSQGYSFYEMQRWERYCDSGQGMDERDWKFVTQAGGLSGAPAELSCTPPDFEYPDYLAVWTRFCEADGPTREDRNIVRNTVRPRSVVNPCHALEAR
ncbi:hypothetical protein DFO67_11581 [Modicisalibacter xianhensis]|uniref:Lipoprotein n=2 Tax=Modicisalibacter xianhensis TaxID=442341 RepID=A0A4R8FKN6_9GAMM|nr:hypothetical protein DFO67_11581 [Halomonas xianhensis]